jgi:hypothetical protein
MRCLLRIGSFCLALICPVVAAPHQAGEHARGLAPSSRAAHVCAADRQSTAANPEYLWRLRAYEDLDCAIAILDDALKTQGDSVLLSREEAERARARIWAARDAAARIGR